MTKSFKNSKGFSFFVERICELPEIQRLFSNDCNEILSSTSIEAMRKQVDEVVNYLYRRLGREFFPVLWMK